MNDAPPSYLITGATGFLGRHLVEAIRTDQPDARIIALVRDSASAVQRGLDYLEQVELVEGSPLNSSGWRTNPKLKGLRGIYHLAAEVKHSRRDTAAMMRFNVDGTLEMVRLADKLHCRLVFISTSGTVGCSTDPAYSPDDDAPYAEPEVRRWPYYMSKIEAEKKAQTLADRLRVELVIMRPPVLLGPGDHRFRSVSNVMRVLSGRLPFIFDGGIHFVDIRDAAAAIVAAMRHPSPRDAYNLPGTSSSLSDFFRRVAASAGLDRKWRVLPPRIVWFLAKGNELIGKPFRVLPDPVVIEMGSRYWGLSSSHAESDLGFRPRTPDATIADTILWIREAVADPGTISVEESPYAS